MNDNNTTLLIQYLDGELEGIQLAEVKSRISSDPLLQQELENLEQTQLAVKMYGAQQQVANIHRQMMEELKTTPSEKAPVVSIMRKVFRVAAIFIVVIGFLALYQYSNLSSQKLFESNYRAYTVQEVRGENRSTTLERLYKQHLTQQVIISFTKLSAPTVDDYFIAGNAYLEQHNATAAIHAFLTLQQKNSQQNTNILEDDSEYYLAMAYLQNNEPTKALPILTRIHDNPQHLYHDKVASLFLLKVKWLSK